MKGNSSNVNPNTDSVQQMVWISIGVVVAIILFWVSAHTAIAAFVMKLRYAESYVIGFNGQAQTVIRQWATQSHAESVTLEQMRESGAIIGSLIKWGVLFILVSVGVFLVMRSPDWPGRYGKVYTMASLARQESTLWPTILPVLDGNLVDVPLDDPVQGMRMRPRDYGYRFKFIVKTAALKNFPADAETINPRETLLLNRARQVFMKQLGRPWQGVEKLQPHEQALFAAFAAQANYDQESAQKLIDDLPIRFQRAVKAKDAKRITSPMVKPLLAKYADSDAVKKVLNRHTYVRTVLMGLLVAARKNGVMPPGWFRWLKTVDRITWYALEDLGTENASIEASGVRSHWNAERLIRAPMDQPEIEAAIDGLRDYLQEILDENPEDDD